MRVSAIVAVTMILGSAAVVMAQQYVGYGSYHSSTAAEGFQRGFADVLRSAGEANLRNSEAVKNYQDARSKYLENRLQATETYFEMRRINKSYRDERRRPMASSEQLHRIAARGRPARLGPTQVDPITGHINWPLILQGEDYQQYRDKLEHQFAQRAESSGIIGINAFKGIQETVDAALAGLRKNIKNYSANDYIVAKKFLESLAHESRYPIS